MEILKEMTCLMLREFGDFEQFEPNFHQSFALFGTDITKIGHFLTEKFFMENLSDKRKVKLTII